MNLDKLAEAKGFKVGDLVQFGIRNGQGGVVVPYRDSAETSTFAREFCATPRQRIRTGAFGRKVRHR